MRVSKFLFIFLAFLPLALSAQNWDINLLKDIHVQRNRSLDPTFQTLSGSVIPLSAAVPAGLITYALLEKDSRSRQNALAVSAAMGTTAVLTLAGKYAVGRKRPYEEYDFIQPLQREGSPSFPSAHTSFSFSLATSLALSFPEWYVIAPSYLWAAGTGYSRMHLGVHYPSDVLAGALIGAGSAYLAHRLRGWLDAQWEKTSRRAERSLPAASPSYDDLVRAEVRPATMEM